MALLLGLSVAACSDRVTEPSGQPITGIEWQLRQLQRDDFSIVVIERPEAFTVEFGEDGQLTALADCNRCFGSHTVSGSSLDVGALACTRAFCPSAPLDSEYVDALSRATSFADDGQQLTVFSEAGVLRYSR